MSGKPELKPCQNTMCALHGNKGNKCLYWGDDADVESCCCYSADLAKPSEWISGPCPTCQTDLDNNGAMISGWLEVNRTHEECAECRFIYAVKPPCNGHNSGPVCCPKFKKPTRETP